LASEGNLVSKILQSKADGTAMSPDEIQSWVCDLFFIYFTLHFSKAEKHARPISTGDGQSKPLADNYAYSFLYRHRELKLTNPIPLDTPRYHAATQANLVPWYRKLFSVIRTYRIIPEFFMNLDETALFLKDCPVQSVVVGMNDPVLPKVEVQPRIPNASVIFSISADGRHLPTVVLWPAASLPPELQFHVDDIVLLANGSGWQTVGTFQQVMLSIIIPAMERKRLAFHKPEASMLLLLDSHVSRCCADVLSAAREKRILIMTIPPHTSQITQPLDLTCNGIFKRNFLLHVRRIKDEMDGRLLEQLLVDAAAPPLDTVPSPSSSPPLPTAPTYPFSYSAAPPVFAFGTPPFTCFQDPGLNGHYSSLVSNVLDF
jgi:hypothetical protein